jgi:hypothetical protein
MTVEKYYWSMQEFWPFYWIRLRFTNIKMKPNGVSWESGPEFERLRRKLFVEHSGKQVGQLENRHVHGGMGLLVNGPSETERKPTGRAMVTTVKEEETTTSFNTTGISHSFGRDVKLSSSRKMWASMMIFYLLVLPTLPAAGFTQKQLVTLGNRRGVDSQSACLSMILRHSSWILHWNPYWQISIRPGGSIDHQCVGHGRPIATKCQSSAHQNGRGGSSHVVRRFGQQYRIFMNLVDNDWINDVLLNGKGQQNCQRE